MNDEAQTSYREYARRQVGTITEALTEVMLGNFSVVARTSEPDDTFGYLCAMVNVAINAARNAQQELQAKIVELETEVAERKQAEAALRESQERLQMALGASQAGTFDYDVATKRCTWDDRSLEIFGLSEAYRRLSWEGILGGQSVVHPEDVPRLKAVHEQALASEKSYHVDYRIRKPDGEERYVQARGVILRNDQGEATRVIGVNFDITERKEIEQEREKMLAELEEKNAELERFTYTVSHDLKSPLVTIKGFVGMLRVDAWSENRERMEKDIQHIESATDQMSRLLGELLELSRIGRLMNPPEAVSLSDLAQEAVAIVAGQIAARGVDVAVASEMPVVQGDRVRLLEVFQNLIDNAVHFIGDQEQPQVEISATKQHGEILCSVRDNGIGIDLRYHEKVFGLFERLDAQSEGTGIGLALVKRIVEVHGGRIWVESQGEGRGGSTFWFALPEHRVSMVPPRGALQA